MEHLFFPVAERSAQAQLEVPYLCNEQFTYDDLGMLTYPERVGVDVYRLCHGGYQDQELSTLVPFVQSWLWFGLLGEALGVGSMIDRPQRVTSKASFVVERATGRHLLNTSKLLEYIEVAGGKNQAPMFQLFYSARLSSCLECAMNMAELLSALLKDETGDIKRREMHAGPPFLEVILVSVELLIATLLRYIDTLVVKNNWPIGRLSTLRFRPRTKLADRLLERAGWPHCQILRLSPDILTRFYLSFISPGQHLEKHAQCTLKNCVEDQGMETVGPAHILASCDCENITISSGILDNFIIAGKVPLVLFPLTPSGTRTLQVTGVTLLETREYVALSHVRSNGLGNDVTNSLPYCRLEKIQMLADDLSNSSGGSVQFWIDTLCVPVKENLKKQALFRAREIFQNANKVLVLEPSLSRHNAESAQESLFRIKYSSWMKRLWTVQEGALAKELYLKFKDSLPSLSNLLAEYDKTPKEQQLLLPKREHYHSSEKLSQMLALFDNDLKLAYHTTPDQLYNKKKLRTMLRLGYLAFPKLRYFGEEDELLQGEIVIDVLEKVYGRTSLSQQIQPANALDDVWMTSLRQRLRLMEETDLTQPIRQPWNYEE